MHNLFVMNFSPLVIKIIKQSFFDTYNRYKREYNEENKRSHRVSPYTSRDKSSNLKKIQKPANRKIDGENDFERRMFAGIFPVADMNRDAIDAIDAIDAVDAVDDDQEDWLDKDEDHTEIDSLVVGNNITEVFHYSADSVASSETDKLDSFSI